MAASSAAATRRRRRDASRRAKVWRRNWARPIRTYCMMTVITAQRPKPRPSAQKYREGLDEGAVLGMLESYGVAGNAMTARAQGAFMTQTAVGSPAAAPPDRAFLRDCEIDGLMFIYDDYPQGLRVTGREILPSPAQSLRMKRRTRGSRQTHRPAPDRHARWISPRPMARWRGGAQT